MKKLLIPILIIPLVLYFFLHRESYTNDTILIGSSLPQTGTLREYGNAVEEGSNAYFHYANVQQIIKNKTIKFLTYDDKYEPRLAFENTQRLLQNKDIFALYGFVGTQTVKNILPMIYQADIPLVATFSGATFLRENTNTNIINFRSSYKNEIQEHIRYLHDIKGFTKIAVFYQNDEYGEDGYVWVVKTLKKYDLLPVAEGNYKRNTLAIRHALNSIKEAKPEAIIMIGANKANTLFIKKAKQNENFKETLFCNISSGDADHMVKNLNGDTKNVIFSQIVPNYQDTTIPIVKEYHKILKLFNEDFQPGFISLESYLSAKLVVTALKNIKGVITRDKFVYNMKRLPKDTLDGISINSKHKDFLEKVYLFGYEDKKFIELLK
ncbi:MAG: ABC transporter substrate-binding protein [Arcobacteraceae bacterium]